MASAAHEIALRRPIILDPPKAAVNRHKTSATEYQEFHKFPHTLKVTSSPLLGFSAIAQPKIKILAWNCVHLLLVYTSMLYSPFFEMLEIFLGIYSYASRSLIF